MNFSLKCLPLVLFGMLGASLPVCGQTNVLSSQPAQPVQQTGFTTVSTDQENQHLLSPGVSFFVPHYYVSIQGGAGIEVGEAKFDELVSPAVQLSLGYQATELFGIRGSLNGLWAKNRYAYPSLDYKWNFLQATLDAKLDLTTLFMGSMPERDNHFYAFVGGGVTYSYGNEDAVEADKRFGVNFQKLWKDHRWNPVVRGGLGFNYYITENIALNAEASCSMLPDHFNSKRGRHDNRDWHFNALLGVKFAIGHRYGHTEPTYDRSTPAPVQQQQQFVDVPVDKISFNVNIYFIINRSDIRTNQTDKLARLITYLENHPKAFVRLSGYADKETGNPTINMRLSRERSQNVSKYLTDRGIEEWRIRRFAKGDTVQPFDIPEDNRVCICYVYDPDNPEPVTNW